MTMNYKSLLAHVLMAGVPRDDRTGVGTRSIFGASLMEDLRDGRLPLLTTKKMNLKPLLTELEWFLTGSTNTAYLHDRGVKLWDPWAKPDGSVGPIYGAQWRSWNGYIDQLAEAVELLKTDPTSRRILVSAWNVEDLPDMALPPCPVLFQFYAQHDELSMLVFQRSGDVFLGVPFDLAQYSILTYIVSEMVGMTPGAIKFVFGDLHLYNNHVSQAEALLERAPFESPTIELRAGTTINNFTADTVTIHNYESHGPLIGKVAI